LVNRLSAFEKFALEPLSLGATAKEITASGTCIEVMV
jgi:hypothetical protein